jgi:hypothetical protein
VFFQEQSVEYEDAYRAYHGFVSVSGVFPQLTTGEKAAAAVSGNHPAGCCCNRRYRFPRASGLMQESMGCPVSAAIMFSAAMRAIVLKVAELALAM